MSILVQGFCSLFMLSNIFEKQAHPVIFNVLYLRLLSLSPKDLEHKMDTAYVKCSVLGGKLMVGINTSYMGYSLYLP